jgi:hypothetical protein
MCYHRAIGNNLSLANAFRQKYQYLDESMYKTPVNFHMKINASEPQTNQQQASQRRASRLVTGRFFLNAMNKLVTLTWRQWRKKTEISRSLLQNFVCAILGKRLPIQSHNKKTRSSTRYFVITPRKRAAFIG